MAIKPVTGTESYWGDVRPTQSQVSLINKSPTLQKDLTDYGAAIAAGEMKPIEIGPDGGGYFDNAVKHRIVLSHDVAQFDDNNWIAGLSHELGHFESRQNDKALAARYDTPARDPSAYNVRAMNGMRDEGEAIYNNWRVEHEILENTTSDGHPGTLVGIIGEAPGGPIEQALDQVHAAEVNAGRSVEQDRNGMMEAAAAMNALQRPSTDLSKTYFDYYAGGDRNIVPPGLGSPTAVQLSDPAGDGNITSMNETYASGMQGTQNFGPDGKLTSADVKDAGGNVQKHIQYARQPDGAYTATTYDGRGALTETDEFDKDGASVAHTFGRNGTQTAQAYDVSGAPMGATIASASPPAAALPASTQTAQTDAGGQAPADDAVEEPAFAESNMDPDAG